MTLVSDTGTELLHHKICDQNGWTGICIPVVPNAAVPDMLSILWLDNSSIFDFFSALSLGLLRVLRTPPRLPAKLITSGPTPTPAPSAVLPTQMHCLGRWLISADAGPFTGLSTYAHVLCKCCPLADISTDPDGDGCSGSLNRDTHNQT